jgi:hypothetical protein
MEKVGKLCHPGNKFVMLLDSNGWTTWQKSHHSAKKSFNFDHEIMEIGIIGSNMIETKPPLQHSWPDP